MNKQYSQILQKKPASIALRLLIPPLETLNRKFLDSTDGVFEISNFPWILHIENQYPEIRLEIENFLITGIDSLPNFQDLQKKQEVLTTDQKWKTLFLYVYGRRVEKNCTLLPKTTELIEGIPGIKNAMLSILREEKHLPKHRGPYNGLLRYHLPLIVPDGQCGIRIGENEFIWKEGKSLVFDDTVYHESWNNSKSVRANLIVDFLRPLPKVLEVINEWVVEALSRETSTRELIRNSNRNKL